MTLGEKISSLRKERSLTQAELGGELGVTYQAVSKWERDESMPDFDMISKLAKLFGVPIAHFENNDGSDEVENIQQDEHAEEAAEAVNHVLGVCTVCGKYINTDNVGTESPKLVCCTCLNEQKAQKERAQQASKQQKEAQCRALSSSFNKRVIIASVVAELISLTLMIFSFINLSSSQDLLGMSKGAYIAYTLLGFVVIFVWIFQLFFDGAVRSVTLAGMFFIRLPGIIFSADLDGLIFLIVMKILFFIISAIVFIGAMVVTSLAAMVLSLFTFVPLIIKIVRRNEDIL